MWEDLLINEAKRRREIFERLYEYLKKIVETVRKIDSNAELYLFGSVAEGKHLISSDIDILVVSDLHPGRIIAELWSNGVDDPFEIHVITRDMLETYKKRAKLIKLNNTYTNNSQQR
ncbi:MAG: nucleotidyltransferase domain-containing protein [archaeon YNP-LCB-003-016]|uniref:nucleotidyltransferase domain-containing protein n=1 Tax=Candidatus Culexarchaeum yellowstonense TaxID=2928963 RepID=UPI0026F11D98|nr:nucleotidyltransferase domain-containing protein [Candidatus Culexarchaeum yellowstonense]MCR6692698.1 nucleotidyltransferase domain-containing protein [Candidatus Culexarchaeum yellowstonense]